MKKLNNAKTSINFNLREPFGNKCTNIYAVIRVEGKQIKIPTGLKINTWQWDKKKQTPIINNNNMTLEDRENAMNVLTNINKIRFLFCSNFMYICNVSSPKELFNILNFFNMKESYLKLQSKPSVTRLPKASKMLREAFELEYGKELSLYGQKEFGRVKAYIDYMVNVKKRDSTDMLKQEAIDDYCTYLKDLECMGAGHINHRCQTIVRLINKVIRFRPEFRKHVRKNNIVEVSYKKLKDSRRIDEDKRRELTQDELEAILNAKGLTPNEEKYRDIFELQLESGVRVSDLDKLLNNDYEKIELDDMTQYEVMTEKEGIAAYIIANERIKEIQEKYKEGIRIYEGKYNEALKSIFEKAGLTKEEKYYMDVSGKKKARTGRLCDMISSHWARHTFITQKLREGYDPNVLCRMTGHADDKMIQKIYSHLNSKDKAKIVCEETKRVKRDKQEKGGVAREKITRHNINGQAELIQEVKDALCYLGADYADFAHINDYHTLTEMLYNIHFNEYMQMGCDMKYIKELYLNEKLDLRERRKLLQKHVNEVKSRIEHVFVVEAVIK